MGIGMSLEDHFSVAFTGDGGVQSHFRTPQAVDRPVDEWWYASSSLALGPDNPVPERPYIVWGELSDNVHREVEESSNARTRTFRFFVYDQKGDFGRINDVLAELQRVAKGFDHFTTDDGIRCSAVAWLGISEQFPDDGYDSCTRYGTVRFTVNR